MWLSANVTFWSWLALPAVERPSGEEKSITSGKRHLHSSCSGTERLLAHRPETSGPLEEQPYVAVPRALPELLGLVFAPFVAIPEVSGARWEVLLAWRSAVHWVKSNCNYRPDQPCSREHRGVANSDLGTRPS